MTFNVISPDDVSRGLVDGLMPVYKRWGETPLETLERMRESLPGLSDVPLSYAGRLDPLAEGIMLVLCGEANKERQQYLGLDKEYEFEVLFGLKTDTGDLLGIVDSPLSDVAHLSDSDIARAVDSFKGPQSFPYPVFSSKTVQGKPLFQWFKEGKIHEIQVPTIDVVIKDIRLIGVSPVPFSTVLEKNKLATDLVSGDFRQKEILASFENVLADSTREFQVAKINLSCTSGTYVRTLAEKIGEKLGMPALAFSIKRTMVGDVSESEVVLEK